MSREQRTGQFDGPRRSDDEILAIAGEYLSSVTGSSWSLEPGPLLRGPGSLGVRLGTAHTDSARHFDLEFLLSVDDPDGTSLINCATGLSSDPETAARQAVTAWCETTATAGLELLSQDGRFATHFPGTHPGGIPGWHTIAGGITGWGLGEDFALKQSWFADTCPWNALGPMLLDDLDRPELNGVRLFVGQGADFVRTEVRVNGRPHADAAAVLQDMAWPRTDQMSVAHTFLLLVHPEPS